MNKSKLLHKTYKMIFISQNQPGNQYQSAEIHDDDHDYCCNINKKYFRGMLSDDIVLFTK